MLQNILQLLPNQNKDWFIELIDLNNETLAIFDRLSEKDAHFKYAENKWTLKQLLDHLTECEKIFNYRALRFSKSEDIALNGFDENLYVDHGDANVQPLAILLEEFKITRLSTIYFFGKLSDEKLKCIGTANNQQYSVEYIVKHIIAHNQHHLNVIKERYLPHLS